MFTNELATELVRENMERRQRKLRVLRKIHITIRRILGLPEVDKQPSKEDSVLQKHKNVTYVHD